MKKSTPSVPACEPRTEVGIVVFRSETMVDLVLGGAQKPSLYGRGEPHPNVAVPKVAGEGVEHDAVAAADQAVLFRRTVKGVADKHQLIASFMAKPFGDLAGNGLHVHMSMLNDKGENVFAGDDDSGSEMLHQAVAGLLAAAPEAMIFLAPHLNSYRRFQDASHAPTSLTWGYENRTASIRIPNDGPANRRFEFRIAGADANPYWLMASLLAGALHGVQNKLTPPAATEGNAYEADAPKVPTAWNDAIDAFAQGKILAPLFGDLFTRVYTALKQQELQKANERVTDFEYDTYLQAF